MKEDILLCPYCSHHSHSKLTTNISDDAVVRCNYCENAFKMEQARIAPSRSPPRRRFRRWSRASGQAGAGAQGRAAASERSAHRLQPDFDSDAESERTDRNELAFAAFVTSLVAFFFAGCLSPIALVFAIIALEKPPRGLAAAALVLSLVGLVPMCTVALPFLSRAVLSSAGTQVTLPDALVKEERASDERPAAPEAPRPAPEQPQGAVAVSDSSKSPSGMTIQEPLASPPELRFSDIKQQHKPLGGIGIYLTAENVSSVSVSRFEAVVQFIDKNGEVVAQDKIRESFYKPIAPGEKRSLLFSPGIYSELRSIVPDTCRGSALLVSVN